jgi:hypothetical protein
MESRMNKVTLAVAIAAAAVLAAIQPANAQRIPYGADVKYGTNYGGHQVRGKSIGQSDARVEAPKKAAKRGVRRRSP